MEPGQNNSVKHFTFTFLLLSDGYGIAFARGQNWASTYGWFPDKLAALEAAREELANKHPGTTVILHHSDAPHSDATAKEDVP